MHKVSIITVNFNQPLLTEQLLSSIFLTNTYGPIEILVVDNGSKTSPMPNRKAEYNNIRLIRSERNLGFAGGNNLGIRQAEGDYYFLVNNDTEFTAGLIDRMVSIMEEHPEVGILSPKIRYFDQPEIIQYVGFTPMNFNTGRNKCIGAFEKDIGQYDSPAGPTGFAHGAAMMVRREAVEKAGLMAENYFLYYEEMDWCERIKRSGYQVWIEPGVLIYHKESMSVGKQSPLREFFMNRNRILFIRKNAPGFSRIVFYFHFALFVAPRNLFGYLRGKRSDLATQFLKAIWWNLTHRTDSMELGYRIDSIK